MKKSLKTLLVLALALSLVFAFGLSAQAAGTVTLQVNSTAADNSAARADGAVYKTIGGALSKAQSGDTVKLMSDIEENVTIAEDMEIILDLNGKVLKGDGSDSVIVNYGTLTVKDSGNTIYYIKDSKCKHSVAIGDACEYCGTCEHGVAYDEYCDECGEYVYETVAESQIAKADGIFDAFNGTVKPAGTEDEDYITVTGGCITGGETSSSYGGGIFYKSITSYGNITFLTVTPENSAYKDDFKNTTSIYVKLILDNANTLFSAVNAVGVTLSTLGFTYYR